MAHWCIALSAASDYRPAFQLLRDPATPAAAAAPAPARPSADATVARSTNGAAIDPQVRAREAIAKAMALRDKVTPRERLYIEAQAARRAPGRKDAADAAYIAGLRKLVAAYPGRSRSEVDARPRASTTASTRSTKEPREHTMEAIALLEEVVAKDDGAVRRASLPDSRLRRQQDAGEGVARERSATPGCVTNIPHAAAHAGTHLRAERQDPGSDLGVLGRRGQRAEVDRVRLALPDRPLTATTSTS